MSKHTFFGVGARAMVEIIDLTGEDTPPALRRDRISVYAYVLGASVHKSTAFSISGEQIYSGNDLDECLSIVKLRLKLDKMEIPRVFEKYLRSSG